MCLPPRHKWAFVQCFETVYFIVDDARLQTSPGELISITTAGALSSALRMADRICSELPSEPAEITFDFEHRSVFAV
jgi:hypothetical protein